MTPELQAMYWLEEIGLTEYVTQITKEPFWVRAWRTNAQGRKTYLVDFYFVHPPLIHPQLADPLDVHPQVHIGFRRPVKKWLAKRKTEKRNDARQGQTP